MARRWTTSSNQSIVSTVKRTKTLYLRAGSNKRIYIFGMPPSEGMRWKNHEVANLRTRKCLEERGYITRDESKSEWDGLYDQGHYLLRERYRGHTNRIVDEVKFLVDQFNEDPLNKAFRESLKRLISDLGGGQHDRLAITKDLYKDAVDVVLPTVFENFRYLPISRIELADPMVDVVSNLLLLLKASSTSIIFWPLTEHLLLCR